jgi:CrcB protein
MVSHPWTATVLVALGSALGGVSRFWMTTVIGHVTGANFPWGTVAVNVVGSALIGAVMGLYSDPSRPGAIAAQQFLAVGVLGGFTTFSSFSLQTLILMRDGEWVAAAANVVGSVVVCVAATWAGFEAASR